MSKARDLADFVSDGSPLSDGTISVSEVSGAAPTASPSFTGNVGVGNTTSATYPVTIQDSSDHLYLRQDNADNGWLINTADADGYLHISRRGEGGSPSNTERMTVTTTGNVGIGATSPNANAKLTLSGGGIEVPTGYGVFNDSGGANATGINFTAAGTNILTFFTGNSERMRINSNGRVGIGVTSMNDATLEIQPASDIPQIKLTQNNVPDGGDGWKFHNSGPTGGNLAIIREGSGVDTEYFRLGTSGQIGLSGANYGTSGQVLTSNGSSSAPSWQSVSFTTNVITTNTTATANNHYYLNGSAITVTLPASPSVGDEVRISEVAGNTDCVIGRNGSNIMGDASDLTIDTAYLVLSLRYVDATIGWAFS